MKAKLTDHVLDDVRESIRSAKRSLDMIKETRKSLIKQIRDVKENIRQGEVAFSSSTNATAQNFIKGELKIKRMFLTSLRQQMLYQELLRDLELVRFKALHNTLDKSKVPFDPEAFAKKHGRQG